MQDWSVSHATDYQCTSNNVRSFLALRLLLGLCEAGLYPGIAFYITRLVDGSDLLW